MVIDCIDKSHGQVPGEIFDYLYVLRRTRLLATSQNPPTRENLRLILDEYLRGWGSMGRTLGGKSYGEKDPVLDKLKMSIYDHWKQVRDLSKLKIWTLETSGQLKPLSELFEGLHQSWVRKGVNDGRKRFRSHVAVGKLLHILLPDLCIIWDDENVLKRKFAIPKKDPGKFQKSGEGYAHYIDFKADQLRNLARSHSIPTERYASHLEQLHRQTLLRKFPELRRAEVEPVTKLLDELNYLRPEA